MSRTSTLLLAASILLAIPATAWAASADSTDAVKQEIARVVEAAYIHGAFNEQNTSDMRAGFHGTFKIHGVRNGELSTYPIDDWVSGIEKSKASPDYEMQVWEHEFPLIDVTGDAAIVKVDLYKVDGNQRTHVYTDYLSLLELEDGWKITDKVYHQH